MRLTREAINAAGHFRGLLCLNEAGQVTYSSGVGDDSRLRALVASPSWIGELRLRRLAVVNLEGRRFGVLWASMDTVDATLASDLILFSDGLTDEVFEFVASVDFAYDIIGHLISDPFDAMTIVDASARVAFLPAIHERFFGLQHGAGVGKPVRQVIENTRLDRVVRTGKAEVGKIQRMRGSNRIVTRTPIKRGGQVVGAIGRVMFKGPEQLQDMHQRLNALESEVEFYRREAAALRGQSFRLNDIVGDSPPVQRLKENIVKLAPLDVPVLITGESGSGKELVAQAIHRLSPRRDQKMVMINSAALPASLVESELFGHTAGAFTGASRTDRKGKIEEADHGTLFLDEIGEMPPPMQAKLLRVLQDGVVERLGGNKQQNVDFRLVTATNSNLQMMVETGDFRLDLFYRISPVALHVPSLRERLEDVPTLVEHFLVEFTDRHGMPRLDVSEEALAYLRAQPWPGNIRQLKHEVERAAIFCQGNRLSAGDFQRGSPDARAAPQPSDALPLRVAETETLHDVLRRVESRVIATALAENGGNKKKVASRLGISRSYLYKKLSEIEEEGLA